MASVIDTVRSSIVCYPSLFENRTEVLHHILCVLGSGFEWVNGEAVNKFPADEKPWTPERETARLADYPTMIREVLEEGILKHVAHYQHIVDTVDDRVNLSGDVGHVYGQTTYALLMTVPEDVTPDWAAACEEMKAYVQDKGWTF